MTTAPTPAPETTSSTRKKRQAVEARIRVHLVRLDDEDLTKDVHRLIRLLNIENARWRHRAKNAEDTTTETSTP